jgi:hypothetical protein
VIAETRKRRSGPGKAAERFRIRQIIPRVACKKITRHCDQIRLFRDAQVNAFDDELERHVP